MASPRSPAVPAEAAPDPNDPPLPTLDGDLVETTNVDADPALPSDGERRREKDNVQAFKKAVLISGIAAAVIGAIFAVVKKLRER